VPSLLSESIYQIESKRSVLRNRLNVFAKRNLLLLLIAFVGRRNLGSPRPAEIHDPAAALARRMSAQMTGPDVDPAEHLEIAPAGFVDESADLNGDHDPELDAEDLAPGQPGLRKRRLRVEPAA
jgi:hypothetical protein